MKYIGNKTRLLPFLDEVLAHEEIPLGGRALDPFSGTAAVARHLKSKGFRVVAGDLQAYAYVQGVAHVALNRYPDFAALGCPGRGAMGLRQALALLDALPGEDGFFYASYAPGGSGGARQYFSDANARKIDAVRAHLTLWRAEGRLTDDGYHLLLACLIDAADFVANMSGTYGAFLKIWRCMALKPLTLKPIRVLPSRLPHRAVQSDANRLVRQEECDLLYLDPPYTGRQYASNFHVLETLALGDRPPLRGKTGLRPTAGQFSAFSRARQAPAAMQDLLAASRARHILLSYNDEGLIPHEQLMAMLGALGRLRVYEHDYRRFRTERDHARRRYTRPDDRVVERIYAVRR
ncbi:MAG: DNA adenine methylase [Candidatus Wallbacteria bacterium]|nr:DNA adenine methylase [Candidatus Wallbacteria bacterium]